MALYLDLERFAYGSAQPILAGAQLSLEANQSLGLVGGSGSGKSSLLTLLAGLHPQPLGGRWSGRLELSGHPIAELKESERVLKLGYMGSEPGLFLSGFCATVREEVAWTLLRLGWDQRRVMDRVEECLDFLAIRPSLRARNPLALSGGEQQLVALASVWAREPDYLLLDEPVSKLDPRSRHRVLEAVQKLHAESKAGVVWATSQLQDVSWCERFLHLEPQGSVSNHEADWNVQETACLGPDADRLYRSGRSWAGPTQWTWPEGESLHWRPLAGPDEGVEHSLEVRGLWYKPAGWEAALFEELDFALAAGEQVGLVGPNGAGKSTLAKLIRGLLPLDKGQLRMADARLDELPLAAKTRLVAYAFQEPSELLMEASVEYEFLYSGELLGLDERAARERTQQALELFELQDVRFLHPRELSAAESSLLGVALCWYTKAPLQILDEPTAHLDGPSLAILERVLADWRNQGVTTVLISHDIDWLLRQCQRFLVLEEGRVLANSPVSELLEQWPPCLGRPLTVKLWEGELEPR